MWRQTSLGLWRQEVKGAQEAVSGPARWWITYRGGCIQPGLEAVGRLRDAPVEVVGLVHHEVVGAHGRHRQAGSPSDSRSLVNALTRGSVVSVSSTDQSDPLHACHALVDEARGSGLMSFAIGLLLARLASATTAALVHQEGVGHCGHYPAAHFKWFQARKLLITNSNFNDCI